MAVGAGHAPLVGNRVQASRTDRSGQSTTFTCRGCGLDAERTPWKLAPHGHFSFRTRASRAQLGLFVSQEHMQTQDIRKGPYQAWANPLRDPNAPQRTFSKSTARLDHAVLLRWAALSKMALGGEYQSANQLNRPGYYASHAPFENRTLDIAKATMSPRETLLRQEVKEHKRLRCGLCSGCTRQDCGLCINCKDKPKFHGPGASALREWSRVTRSVMLLP